MKVRLTTERKFWKKVNRDGLNDCWEWGGRVDRNGRGVMDYKDAFDQPHTIGAHIYIYNLMVEDVPGAAHVVNTCGNKGCVNPHHLELKLWGK